MKKLLMTAMIFSMLVLPVNSVSPAGREGTPAPAQLQGYLPGDVPAEIGLAESMTPAFHALALAMVNHGVMEFDRSDSGLVWEGLYNMLSMYGQLDSRCQEDSGELLLPEETVRDYAAALSVDLDELGDVPAGLRDRINYDNVSQGYLIVCGEDDPTLLQADGLQAVHGGFLVTGALVYEEQNDVLAQLQATLQPRDNMFGCAIASLTIQA